MAFKTGQNRYQATLLPDKIDNYIAKDDPARAYDAFIDALDFEDLGINLDENKVGNSAYHPRKMLKLLVYGYSYGWRSSRKLERATHHNLSFIWLMEGLKPDHKTISEFRRKNKKALAKVLKQCARLCIQLNLIEGNTLFVDGTKIRGNSSINQTKTKKTLKKRLKHIDKRIEEILAECKNIDKQETGSLVKLPDEIEDTKKLKSKIEKALEQMEKEGKEKVNLTDKDTVLIKSRQGTHAGYNAQSVVDEKNGLIVSTDVVSKSNDMGEFTKQISKANEVLNKDCKTACADAGYSDSLDLKKAVEKGIEVVVPSQNQASHKPKKDKPFTKDKFKYNEKENCYVCPAGNKLTRQGYNKKKRQITFKITNPETCKKCIHYGEGKDKCTKAKYGRTIKRLEAEKTKEKLEALYESDRGQEIYEKRKSKVELPFGHIKRNLNGWLFLLRGKLGVNAEMAINSTCFNIRRMITLLGGVCAFVNEMKRLEGKIKIKA